MGCIWNKLDINYSFYHMGLMCEKQIVQIEMIKTHKPILQITLTMVYDSLTRSVLFRYFSNTK